MRIFVALLSGIFLTALSSECLRTLQSASYRPQRGYFKLYLSPYFLALVFVQTAAVLSDVFLPYGAYVNAGLYFAAALAFCLIRRKTPLKLTKRMGRLLFVQTIVLCALCVFVNSAYWAWLLPAITLVCWAVCLPTECAVNAYYTSKARRKLSAAHVTVIAVTGSYGKTTVKDMLCALLENSVSPQGSCNTPLGIAAYVNRTDFVGVKYVVLEFGARKRGDIAKLCKLYSPFCGIVTGVCAQHLSTFKSLQNVIATKRELTENLPKEGFCVLNDSDGAAADFTRSGVCAKLLSHAGIEIRTVATNFDGTTLSVSAQGEENVVRLPQISDYVGDALAMCLQTATALGQSFRVTLQRAVNVRQTPHRLQPMKGDGFWIVDDSYNGSIAGVKAACATLSRFCCAKVVITQGIVECGKLRREMNTECGEVLGRACDVAVVLGKNAKYLAEGILSTDCRMLVARSLNEAVSLAAPYARGGILLFQNDLPDSVAL